MSHGPHVLVFSDLSPQALLSQYVHVAHLSEEQIDSETVFFLAIVFYVACTECILVLHIGF